VLVAIAGAGAVIDTLSGSQARGGFNIGIVAAAVVAILVVRRSAMFPVVVAPPIVYSAVSGMLLYARSNGLHDHKIVIDTAANWLVYGFPAIAAATASVLIIAGIRLLTRR
jgi:fumarate reductase subunit D